jgi:hypothetical protein
MANSRKKISELPALSPASLDTTFVVGISGSTTYKISINNLTSSLDTTFATDLVTNALSNTLDTKLSTSSFNSYTASFTSSVASGTISGSSQLTSSFDTRYIVSGSVTQTTWDNISGKPAGIVSQSTDLSSLNTFTASISTASLVNRLNTIESVSGSWITESETGSFLTSLSGAISSSTQISDLGFVTGSYTTINSFNSLTQSFNSISQSFNVISGSVGTVDFSTLATTGSNIFSGSQTISGGLSINNSGYSWSFESNGRTKIPNITFNSDRGTGMVGIKPAPGREFQIETSTAESSVGPWSFGLDGTLSAPVGANILRVGNLVTTSSFNSYTASISTASLVTSITNLNSATSSYLTSLSGAISSSSQLTSSYDTRYTLSGSVQPLPSNLLSSSAQITAFGFISSSQTIDSGSLLTTSSFNSYTASISTASLVTSISNLNTFTASVSTASIVTSISNLNTFTASVSTASLVTSISNLNTATSSYETKGRSIVSGSSQLTSSYDGRYIQTGSFNTYTSSFSSSLVSSITSVSGSFTNLTVNGQPTTYGVVSPDYINAGRITSDQTSMGVGNDIIFNSSVVSSGISLNTSTGVFTLTANKTYKLFAELSFSNFSDLANGYIIYDWVDATTNTRLDTSGVSAGVGEHINRNTNEFNATSTTLIYTPTTNQTIKVRIVEAAGTVIVRQGIGTKAIIQQINPTIAVQATATGTLNSTIGSVVLSNSYSQVVGASIPGTTIFTLPTLQPGTYLITAQAKVNGGYSAMGIFTGGSQVANTSVFSWYQSSGTVNNGLQGTWVLTVTTPTVYTINAWGGGTVSAGSDGAAVANYIQINPTFALNTLNTMQISGSLTTTGSITSLGGITGSIAATNGVISGSSQLTSSFPSKTTGAWSVPAGASTQSFTVESGHSYSMWVNGNIPNGIITWNATVTTSNTNVPAVGSQYGWYYTAGNALVLTAMPDQIIGTNGSIANIPTSYAPNTSNVFKFGITNNSGTTQTINYGYIKLS